MRAGVPGIGRRATTGLAVGEQHRGGRVYPAPSVLLAVSIARPYLHWRVNKDDYMYKVFEHKYGVRKQKLLHRIVMGVDDLKQRVDHIRGNKLDVRREMLQFCTHAENFQNSAPRTTNKSGYKGVYQVGPALWQASIMCDLATMRARTCSDTLKTQADSSR